MTDFFEAWDAGNREEMIRILRKQLSKYESDDEREQVALLKRRYESDLPHDVVAVAVGCDIRTCRDIRWMGRGYGVVDRTGTRERVSIPPSKRQKIIGRDGNVCVRCGESDEDELEIHHIIPLSQGGLDDEDNLATLCKDCNKKAHAGDFSSKRTAYDGVDEFWSVFVGDYE